MRFRLHDNPVVTLNVNDQGYRGTSWPEVASSKEQSTGAKNGEILVVGDSQVFGLGVEDQETFSARLAKQTGRVVLNDGVPTYGPGEYFVTAREIIEKRKPQTLVYVVNFLNDPFELHRPNTECHAEWDGWAVRIESGPDDTVGFPGRRWLMSQSHLVYALRRYWNERAQDADKIQNQGELGFPSEGTWNDLVMDGKTPNKIS
ncbi:MAG: hypothetical protein GY822_17960 [Deltaproteobacteria bacterium]|nr:hypothetical protein [Deltaproteobacteria bacterium]